MGFYAAVGGGGNSSSYSYNKNSSGAGNLTPIATTTEATGTKTGSGTSSSSSVTNSTNNSITNLLENTQFNKKNMTPEALAALMDVINSGGSNTLLATQETGKKKQQGDLESMIANLLSGDIQEQASGNVADLGRQLREQVLPQIFGGAEMAGSGGDALSQLLAQDAAIRTGEAQARVQEDVRSNVQNQATQASQVLTQLLDSGSGTMDALLNALGIAKGSVEQGSETKSGTQSTTGTTQSTTTQAGQTSSNESSTNNASTLDPLAWAKLQTELQIALEQANASQPSKGELALALFNASKGPYQSLGDIAGGGASGSGYYNSLGGGGDKYGSNALMEAIQQYL